MKKSVKPSTMLGMKGFLILIAFGVWAYVMMRFADSGESLKDAVLSYGGNTIVIVSVAYFLLLLLEVFVDIRDTD